MTSQSSYERFEEIDWDDVSRGSLLSLSSNTKGFLVATAAVVALLGYDLLVVPAETATFEAIGSALEAVGLGFEWGYDVSQTDWPFAFTILLLAFFGALPLYQNPRMARYYWTRFKRNRLAVMGLGFLLAIFAIGIIGPLFISKPELSVMEKYQPP